jgi:phospholipid/cholesterol/gamma-HCH transport system substrate-binding protein
MKSSGIAVRVGIFVVAGLALIGGLILQFGRLQDRLVDYRRVHVMFKHLAPVVIGAAVTMSGVRIGSVGNIELANDGRSVKVTLNIEPQRTFGKDARIVVRQAGLLGDMYLEVVPAGDKAGPVGDGDTLEGEEPPPDIGDLLMQGVQIVRKANNAVSSIEHVAKTLDEKVLTEESAARVRQALANIEQLTTNLVLSSVTLRDTVEKSKPQVEATLASVRQTATNLTAVVGRADQLIANADKLLAENRAEIQAAIRNVGDSAAKIAAIVARLENGQGTIGKLLADQTLHEELVRLIANWRRFGILYKEGGKAAASPEQTYVFGAEKKKQP